MLELPLKYTIIDEVWRDKISGQRYTREFALTPLVSFNVNGEVIRGYVYNPYGVENEEDLDKSNDYQNLGYRAGGFGQSLFLTEEQVAERFEYQGKIKREEDINSSIKQYSEENCNFENKNWIAEMSFRDLIHRNSGGLSQCIHAKIFEFYLNNALEECEEKERLKKAYYSEEEK